MPQAALTSPAKHSRTERSALKKSTSVAAISWRDRPYQQIGVAADIAQVSEGSIYKAEKEGKLTFVRLAGRTLVETASLIAFIGQAEPWAASDRGAAARAKRAETARSALRR